ncbi:nuclease-related domain-containing protein [Litchfieldia alkalitelluris]|uniref:nuclease-related domain-containing protein n=1 Tax=Litchfieldia alkalitelluris TaxID=304268 RepID=UPI0009973C8E|nr:nuclease-related domain-containing protein [Litchfieldia alkalitelluris]
MILKERKYPLIMKQLQALIRRIPPNHPTRQVVIDDFKKREAGYKGEVSIDYHLSFLDNKEFYILHDLRLADDQLRYFQIDTLILSSKMFIILEVKNIAGTLIFDNDFKQLIRVKEGEETGFRYPITQTSKKESQFQNWLRDNRFTLPPITSFVVISNPQTIIKAPTATRIISQKVIHSENIVENISRIESLQTKDVNTDKELRKLARHLIKQHVEFFQESILSKYNLTITDLIKGVICEYCNNAPLKRIHGNWYCSICNNESREAHIPALLDYALIISPTITNSQLREYLLIDSVSVSNKLLKTLNLDHQGQKKMRIYYIPFNLQ